jgi:hypothetical protein
VNFVQADTPWLDSTEFPILGKLADIIESAMNSKCASNVLSLVCHAWFKECKPVDGGFNENQMLLPSLLCRSECHKHWEAWNVCLNDLDLDNDPAAKSAFETQMMAVVGHLRYCTTGTPVFHYYSFCVDLAAGGRSLLGGFYCWSWYPPTFFPAFRLLLSALDVHFSL